MLKKKLIILILLLSVVSLFGAKGKLVTKFPFYVFKDSKSSVNNYSPSGWMGDHGDISVNDKIKVNPKSGTTCLRVKYSAKMSNGKKWGGIYWQNPANNWGKKKGGFDLSKAKKITFYARGRQGGEVIEFKIGGISGKYTDTATESTGVIKLTKNWKKYSIDLVDADCSYIGGGFCAVFTRDSNPKGAIFYLDDIKYE